ncbi:MAG: alpha-rhamnosidase, partial [Cyclobacteriaceae bacterium]|nr:alpha-rhamnosidase [Cyclobacteriaceae bacterium]
MKQILIFFLLVVLFFSCQKKSSNSLVVNLKCEHLINPIGIDSKNPRFSWQLVSKMNGIAQEAFQIILGTDSLFTEESQIWDSGKIDSDKNRTVYNGPVLKPFTRYFWGVQLWDNQG